jgi:hypothetical protein
MIAVHVLVFMLFVIGLNVTTIEPRFFYYYFIFVLGILANRYGLLEKQQPKRTLFLYLIGSVILIFSYFQLAQYHVILGPSGTAPTINNQFSTAALSILLFDSAIALCIMLALSLTRYYARIIHARARSVFSYVAFASYAVFLFHQDYIAFLRVSLTDIAHLGYIETLALAVLLGIPVLIILCFHLQKQTNKFVDRISKHFNLFA